jgi:hypothetical protein
MEEFGVSVESGLEGSQLYNVIKAIISKLLQCEDEGKVQLTPLASAQRVIWSCGHSQVAKPSRILQLLVR